jgi:hypothetical protein
VNCHCRDCQKASGGAYTSSLFVPKDTLKIIGDVKYYDATGDSGQTISRGFCPNCGSALFGKPAIQPDLISIRPGTLDDPSKFQPAIDIYTASAQPWDYMNPELPKYPKLPPGS